MQMLLCSNPMEVLQGSGISVGGKIAIILCGDPMLPKDVCFHLWPAVAYHSSNV